MKRRQLSLVMAQKCRERMLTLGITGGRRDRHALTFLSGFCSALESAGVLRTDIPLDLLVMTSIGGYSAVEYVISHDGEGRIDGAEIPATSAVSTFGARCEAFARDVAQLAPTRRDAVATLAGVIAMARDIVASVTP